MPWTPLPRIAFAIATQPFNPTTRDDLPLELGDELYIIEQCADGDWYRGYLVPPPSLLAGLTSTKGATLEARVFSGVFPACCVKVREFLSVPLPAGEAEEDGGSDNEIAPAAARNQKRSRSRRKRDEVVRANSVRRREDRVRPAAPVPMLKVGDETSSYEGEPLVDEIASCLKEWHAANLHELLLNREYTLLGEVSALVQQLDLSRRQLLYNVLTRAELVKLREETVWRLVRGNKLLSREIIVRDPHSGRILTGEDSSVEITTLQSVMSLLDEPPKMKGDDVGKKHHLQIEQKGFVGRNEPVTVFYYLATKSNRAVSEMFVVELNSKGQPVDAAQAGRPQALFMDISTRDTEDLYLVARVYTNGFISTAGPNAGNRVPEPTKPPSVISREEKKLKGRVSVLFNSRPRTAGKENDSKPSTSHSNKSQGGSRPGSATSTPPMPTLQAKKIPFRKAVGVGVLDVGRFIKQEQSTEQIMHVLVSDRAGTERAGERGKNNDGENWDRLVRDVIESRTKSPAVAEPLPGTRYRSPTLNDGRSLTERNVRMDKLHLYLRPFAANDGGELIKSTPTILHQAVPTRKIGFSGAPTKSRSDIYITLNSLSLPRHALLIHPKLGSSPMPPSSQFNQLQLSMEVRRATGERIASCIFPSSGSTGMTVYKSAVVTREEPWSQTVRLSLKDDDVPNAHVFLSISGIPNPPAAMAWFPLWDQGAFLRDGDHDLVLHKYDEHTMLPRGTAPESGYISQPWTPGQEGWAAALNMGGVAAYIKIRSYLCSTEFSQDDVLLPLLRWKGLDQRQLIDVLKKAGFVPEIEIVKLLREVFDALFGILVENTTKAEIEDLVFYALITVLGIVYDRRFNMEPIVDKYAEETFDYPFAAPCLIRSFTRLLNDPLHMENSVRLRAAFKVGKHIFRFIVKAREKQVLKEATIGINATQSFTKDLRGIFKLLERLMLNSEKRLVGSQTLAVQHFSQWLPELMGVFTREEISLVAIDFMDACSDVAGKLVLYKLLLIVNYSRSDLFSRPEDRRALTVNTIRWLEPHWGKTDRVTEQYREQVRLCCSVLAEQVDELAEVSEYMPKIIDSYRSIQATGVQPRDSLSLLFPKTYPFPTKPINGRPVFDEALAELAAIIAAMSNIPSSLHLVLPEEELATFLMDTLKVHKSILSCEAFPEDWLSVHIYQHKSTMRTLETLAGILVDSFLPDPDDTDTFLPGPDDADKFNMELWQAFFSTLLQLVGSDALALETFPEQKRRAVWKVGGDVREQGADLLRRTWEAIGWETSPEEKQMFTLEKMGGFQVQYVPGLVAPIVELCLSVHEGLRSVAVEVLQTMVVSEWSLNEDLSVIQAEMIDSLDRLFKSKRLTESITQKLFIADLIELFKPLSLRPEDPLSVTVGNLLRTVDEFLDLLVAVHNTPLGEAYQIMDTLRLMEFLKDMRKEDMFIRYVHQLVQVQLSSNNLVEAALSLKLHADLYAWDIHEKVPALEDPKFPEQTAFERREQLFLEMISYFEDGKSWENAAETYRELAEQYENTVFEYGKLSRCQRAMAKLQETILEGQRVEPLFYRVAYYGLGFPVGLRDRQFIVQAGPYETLSMFSDRMLMQHPAARLVDGVVDEVEGQYIHVLPVRPDIDYTHPSFRKQRVPAAVREYVSRRDLRAFSIQHHRDEAEEGGDQDEWDEKTVFLTAESFPTILKRSEVTGVHTLPVSPVSRAIRRILSRTKVLLETERGYTVFAQPDKALDLSPLSLVLSAAVDAHTSVAGFRRLIEHADTAMPLREALKTVLADHVLMVKKALGTHGRLVTDGLRGVQAGCVKCFEVTFRKELAEALPPPSLPVVGGAAAAAAVGQWRPQGAEEGVEVGRARVASVVFGAGGQRGASGAGVVVKVNGVGGHGEKDPVAMVGKRGRKESSATVASGRSSGRGSGRSASRGKGGIGGGGKEDRVGVAVVVGAGGTGAGGEEERKAGIVGKRVGSVRRRWSQLNLGGRKSRKIREGMGMEVAAVLEE